MNCPRCARELEAVPVAGVVVDACQDGCGGIWFDLFELEKMDQPDEPADRLLRNIRVDIAIPVDVEKPISCPRCNHTNMMQQRYPDNQHIMIDKCPVCGGIWLDFGELFEIRSSNPTTGDRRATTAELLRGLRQIGS